MRFFKPFWVLVLAALAAQAALAETLVVYPLSSQDPRLGAAISQRLAEAFEGHLDVYGPAVAPTLVPPVAVAGGYYNPGAFVSDTAEPAAAALFRQATGADAVINGQIYNVDNWLILEMNLAVEGRTHRLVLEEPATDPGALARRAAGVAARLLGLDFVPEVAPVDLSGSFGVTTAAIYLIGVGELDRAEALLAQEGGTDPLARELLDAMAAVRGGTFVGNPALLAALSLSRPDLDEEVSAAYFAALARRSDLPAVALWRAMLLVSAGSDAAAAALDDAATYPYGRAVQAAWRGVEAEEVRALIPGADVPALLALSVQAQLLQDLELEAEVLTRITRLAPELTYPFQRLSFIALDLDDPLAGAQALAAAARLAPDSDLYWTNLGWFQYLLGLLEQSEEASIRALLLAPNQVVAAYNLGLVQTVTGRLDEALESYDQALFYDVGVHPEAIIDLENALERHPAAPEVHYALGYLLEAAGRRADAAAAYAAYAGRVAAGSHRTRALERVETLSGPPPALELPGGVRLFLGPVDVTSSGLQLGDPLQPSFEVYTPDEALPGLIEVEFALADAGGGDVHVQEHQVRLPPDTVGFVIDGLVFELPADVPLGELSFEVRVSASEDRSVSVAVPVSVGSFEDPLRPLIGWRVNMDSLITGTSLYGRNDLGRWDEVLAAFYEELEFTQEAAEDVMPLVDSGRFAGMDGGEVFRATTESDLLDFILWIARADTQGARFAFAEAYAQWALDGAPAP